MLASWRLPRRFRVVIVNLKSERDLAYRGVLWEQRGPWLFFRQVEEVHGDKSPATPMDGELMVHRENVSFIQVV